MICNKTQWSEWAKAFPAFAAKEAAYKSPFNVRDEKGKPVEILIYDQIGKDWFSGEGLAAKEFAEIMAEIPHDREIVLAINSPGGSVWDGLAIYSLAKARGEKLTTRIDGIAASIASVIMLAGSKVKATPSSIVMIHKAWGMCVGNADDMKKLSEELAKHDDIIAGIYSAKNGQTKEKMIEAMKNETWFNGMEAKLFGLIDEVNEAQINALAVAPQNKISGNDAGENNQKKENQMQNPPTAEVTAPAASPDNAKIIGAIENLTAKIENMSQPAPGAQPIAYSVENLGNPLVEKFNALRYDRPAQAALAKEHYADLRKQQMIAAGVGGVEITAANRFDFSNPNIRNANTVDSALANTVLANEFVTTMRSYIAPWGAFTRTVATSPVSRRQTLEVPLASSSGSMQTNATNYETGDSTLAPIAVTVGERSKSFFVSRPEQNLGLQLAALVPTNAKVLAEGIHALITATMTNANFGADNVIGAAVDFDSSDLRPVLALGKNFNSVRLLLDGGHLAYLLPSNTQSFKFGEAGAYGFDGGIYKNNLWTSAASDICGFVCGPDAIVTAWGSAENLPAGEALSTSIVDVNGIPFSSTVWFSRASRAVWSSFQVMFGTAVGDATQGKVLTTQ